jgi:hypothetical protein
MGGRLVGGSPACWRLFLLPRYGHGGIGGPGHTHGSASLKRRHGHSFPR